MAYEHKEGQGSLFKNEKQNDRQPDYKGTIMIGGVTYEVAAWERTSQRGSSYLSLQASLPRERDAQAQPSYQGRQATAPAGQAWSAPMQPTYSAPVQPAYSAPAQPAYSAPAQPQYSAPMPTVDDIPAAGPDDDLPF